MMDILKEKSSIFSEEENYPANIFHEYSNYRSGGLQITINKNHSEAFNFIEGFFLLHRRFIAFIRKIF